MVTFSGKVVSIGENFDWNTRKEKSKWSYGIWPLKLKALSNGMRKVGELVSWFSVLIKKLEVEFESFS